MRIALALLLLFATAARAEVSFRMGMEIELQRNLLERIVPYFDWEQVEKDLTAKGKVTWKGKLKSQPLGFLADLAIGVANARDLKTIPNYPPLRQDLSSEVSQAFAGLIWHEDNNKMEFSHRTPLEDTKEYVTSVRRFARLAGVEDKLDKPNDRRRVQLSYHVHLSRADGVSIERPLEAYNRLTLMKLIGAGNADELFKGQRLSFYTEDITERGAVRLLDPNHFELRRHVLSPEKEMAELEQMFALPEAEAIRAIETLTKELLTPKHLAKLIQLSPSEALSIVGHVRPDWLMARAFTRALAQGIFLNEELPRDLDMFTIHVERIKETNEAKGKAFLSGLRSEVKKQLAGRRAKEDHTLFQLLTALNLPTEKAERPLRPRGFCGPSFADMKPIASPTSFVQK